MKMYRPTVHALEWQVLYWVWQEICGHVMGIQRGYGKKAVLYVNGNIAAIYRLYATICNKDC